MEYLPMSFYVDKNGVVVEETAGLGPKEEIEAHIKKTIASGGPGGGVSVGASAAVKVSGAAAGLAVSMPGVR
jgi:hypothetical protein